MHIRPPEILYHYCSTASFLAIVRSRSLWLSSLSLSNDSMEGKVVAKTIIRMAESQTYSKVSPRLNDVLSVFEQIADGLGFCLSEKGDLLSQWRGYTDDATGVSIGFSEEYLRWLSETSEGHIKSGLTLQQIEYDVSAHESIVKPVFDQIKKYIDAGALEIHSDLHISIDSISNNEYEQQKKKGKRALAELSMALFPLVTNLFHLKSPAFSKECEWRLLSYLRNFDEDCSYRSMQNRLIPYRKIELIELTRKPIIEIILGAKHITPPNRIEALLKHMGYGGVRVRKSSASYQ